MGSASFGAVDRKRAEDCGAASVQSRSGEEGWFFKIAFSGPHLAYGRFVVSCATL